MARATVSGDNEVRSVVIEGEVDISNLHDMKASLEPLLTAEEKASNLVIDLSRADYIDSAVLELIVKARHKLSQYGGRLTVITQSKSQPDRVLRTCRFDSILELRTLDHVSGDPASSRVPSQT